VQKRQKRQKKAKNRQMVFFSHICENKKRNFSDNLELELEWSEKASFLKNTRKWNFHIVCGIR
jgi:hypothetical protein